MAALGAGAVAVGAGVDLNPNRDVTPEAQLNISGPSGAKPLDVRVGNEVVPASISWAGETSTGADIFIGDGKRPGHVCLILAENEETSSVGCERETTITDRGGFHLGAVGLDGTFAGAVLLPAGSREVKVSGKPSRVLAQRVVPVTTKGRAVISALVGSNSRAITVEIPEISVSKISSTPAQR